MSVKGILLTLSLAGVMLAGIGCGRPYIVDSNAGVYSRGKLFAVASHDLETTYQATVKAVNDLEMSVTDQAKDVFSAKVLAAGADGKKVKITLKPREDGDTDLTIAIGMGNRSRSLAIYDQIKMNLGTAGK
ncbi:MAG: DUF3568 family protein [Planctomycetota bacterium]